MIEGIREFLQERGMPPGFPRGLDSLEELERMLKMSSRPKIPREIMLDAEIAGKKSEIQYLSESIEGFHEKVAKLTKELDEKKEAIKKLDSDLSGARIQIRVQSDELERKNKHIANITVGKEGYSKKLGAIHKHLGNLEPLTNKTSKADLLKTINAIKAAL